MRDRKNNISLDVDSALALMQEIYNDVVENRNTASLIMKKIEKRLQNRIEEILYFHGISLMICMVIKIFIRHREIW
mgnify:CR=1 FL=1